MLSDVRLVVVKLSVVWVVIFALVDCSCVNVASSEFNTLAFKSSIIEFWESKLVIVPLADNRDCDAMLSDVRLVVVIWFVIFAFSDSKFKIQALSILILSTIILVKSILSISIVSTFSLEIVASSTFIFWEVIWSEVNWPAVICCELKRGAVKSPITPQSPIIFFVCISGEINFTDFKVLKFPYSAVIVFVLINWVENPSIFKFNTSKLSILEFLALKVSKLTFWNSKSSIFAFLILKSSAQPDLIFISVVLILVEIRLWELILVENNFIKVPFSILAFKHSNKFIFDISTFSLVIIASATSIILVQFLWDVILSPTIFCASIKLANTFCNVILLNIASSVITFLLTTLSEIKFLIPNFSKINWLSIQV